tara:strand:+ start:115 stop:981 length:867 start_codon:yes stop_codon:yes gene_type:complete
MAEDLLRYNRSKQLAHCLRVVAKDGSELLFTDHDRKLTVENKAYLPIVLGSLSADRREGGLRSGDQDVRGVIDGTTITLPQLRTQKYRGATVYILLVDWARPAIVYSRHRRIITRIVFDGSNFVGTMESVTQKLRRPTGGRFGGYFSQTCQYELGGDFCRANISAETVTAAEVDSVPDEYMTVRFTTASFAPPAAAQVDDYYRDGSIVWTSGDNVGQVSPIVGFTYSTRECRLLVPTLKPMQVGDEATVKPGCNGLFDTCKDKFSNQVNFGGSDLEPTASTIREPVIE